MLVKASRSEIPQVRLSIVEDFTTILVEAVASDRLDLACVYRSEAKSLVFEPLLRQNLCFITAPGTTQDENMPISLAEIVHHPLVLSGAKHGFRQRMEAAFGAANLTFSVAYEVQSESLAKELVQQGNNGTILPLSAVRANVQEGKLIARPIEPAITVELYLTYKEQRTLSPSQKAVRNLIRRIAHDLADLDDTLWTYSGDQ
jgi:LysR family nitrogen assimilation transcriptional regulator